MILNDDAVEWLAQASPVPGRFKERCHTHPCERRRVMAGRTFDVIDLTIELGEILIDGARKRARQLGPVCIENESRMLFFVERCIPPVSFEEVLYDSHQNEYKIKYRTSGMAVILPPVDLNNEDQWVIPPMTYSPFLPSAVELREVLLGALDDLCTANLAEAVRNLRLVSDRPPFKPAG